MVHDVTVALSVGGIFGQVAIAALLVVGLLALVGVRAPLDRFRTLIGGYELWIAFLVAGGSTAGSLFYSEFANFYPGEVAWYERICMYPLSVLILLIALGADRYGVRYVIAFPIVGISVSTYALLLEDHVVAQSESCVLSGPGGCVTKWINEFGYVTIPVLSITGFVLILAFLLFAVYSPTLGTAGSRAALSHEHVTAIALGVAVVAVVGVTAGVIATSGVSPVTGTAAVSSGSAARMRTPTGNATVGESIFRSNSCGVCHTLAVVGAAGTIGPNLDTPKDSYAKIVDTITNGGTLNGLAMSPFKTALTAAQIQDVATFIYQTEHPHA